jgi:uncharacterized protein
MNEAPRMMICGRVGFCRLRLHHNTGRVAMACGTCLRLLTATALFAAEAVVALTMLAAAPAPAGAQLFDDRFPFQSRRQRSPFDWFEPAPQQQQERSAPPVDYSRAPAPKKADPKAEGAVTTPIMVFGDATADWLAYGLELAYADSPEIGILRRHRTNSGLIRTEVRNDPRGEYPDWPLAAREIIAGQKPKFVLMMIGINDRRQIREAAQVAPAARAVKPAPQPAEDSASLELDKPAPDKAAETPTFMAPEPTTPGGNRTLEFRTDAWSEAYIRRIDDTIAALKTSGVPVFWVGLPPLRGQKSAADIPFLNDLYRSRADKAGIIYIDVWDGFVDEDGRYVQSGPDVEGQTRRLRTSDGVYFTQAGARKLAHYVEREVQRWLSTRAAPVALAIPEEPKVEAPAPAGRPGVRVRPLSGPTMPLIAERASDSDELLGGNARQPAADAMVTKVLVRGEPVRAPAGRADDFAWPRRGIAPVGSDPVVATTDLPMTPMVAERSSTTTTTAAAAPTTEVATAAPQPAKPVRRTPRPAYAEAQSMYRPDYRRPPVQQQFNFQSLFGGRW